MTPKTFSSPSRVFVAPTNWDADQRGECADLHILDIRDGELNIMYSAWKPTKEEITDLLLGAPIWLGIVGTSHPVVSISVGDPEETVARK